MKMINIHQYRGQYNYDCGFLYQEESTGEIHRAEQLDRKAEEYPSLENFKYSDHKRSFTLELIYD